MIGLDTNVVLRLIVEDDPEQTRRAAKFIESHCTSDSPGFINRITLCETIWVLESGHGYDRNKIAAAIRRITETMYFVVEDQEHVLRALDRFERAAADFADALVAEVNVAHGCKATATFDRKAVRLGRFIPVP
jgi:predicted nucleic-acid-binding protein